MNYALETWGVTMILTLVTTYVLCQTLENKPPESKLGDPKTSQQSPVQASTTLPFHQGQAFGYNRRDDPHQFTNTTHVRTTVTEHSTHPEQPLPGERHAPKDPRDLGRALDESSRAQGRDLLGFLFGRRDTPPPIHQYRPPMGPPRNQYFHHPERGPGPMVNPIFSNKDINMPSHKLEGGFVPIKKVSQVSGSDDQLEPEPRPTRKIPCDFYTDSICLETNPYPYEQLRRMAADEMPLIQKLIVDVRDQNAGLLVDGVSSREEVHYTYEHYYGIQSNNTHSYRDYGSDGGYICPSDIQYTRPKRAKNAQGKWKIIINFGEFSQTVRMERCLKPYAKCSYVFNYINSECLQVYNYQRFLSWDQSMGFHIDIYKVPTACSCHLRSSVSMRKPTISSTEIPTAANTIDRYGNIVSAAVDKEVSGQTDKRPLENSDLVEYSHDYSEFNNKADTANVGLPPPPVPVPIRLGRPNYRQRIMFGSSATNPHSGYRNRIIGPHAMIEPGPHAEQVDTNDEDQSGFGKVNFNFNPMTAYMLPRST